MASVRFVRESGILWNIFHSFLALSLPTSTLERADFFCVFLSSLNVTMDTQATNGAKLPIESPTGTPIRTPTPAELPRGTPKRGSGIRNETGVEDFERKKNTAAFVPKSHRLWISFVPPEKLLAKNTKTRSRSRYHLNRNGLSGEE